MNSLQPPDSFHLAAAEGWIGLGNWSEAESELDQIEAGLRRHPDVLKVRLFSRYHAKDWPACIELAEALMPLAHDLSWVWVFYANSLYFSGQTHRAYDVLQPVVDRFPKNWEMRYNLGCYACQLGRKAEARKWLACAMKLGEARQVKQVALEDSDYAPIRQDIETLEPESFT